MNWPKKELCSLAVLALACFAILACGVKGDPLPPEKPVELGRGRPTYKRATEEIPIEKARPRAQDEEDKDEDEERE